MGVVFVKDTQNNLSSIFSFLFFLDRHCLALMRVTLYVQSQGLVPMPYTHTHPVLHSFWHKCEQPPTDVAKSIAKVASALHGLSLHLLALCLMISFYWAALLKICLA